jgi:hypothetical protein
MHRQLAQESASRSSRVVQRKCACARHAPACAACRRRKQALQRQGLGRVATPAIPASVAATLRTPGQPLPPTVGPFMQHGFGQDFSSVRVHTDPTAARSAAALDARAYTVGEHIVFADGQFAPTTTAGRFLLAHELTHVVQQRLAGTSPAGPLVIGSAQDRQEREADQVAARVVSGEQVTLQVSASTPGRPIRRRPDGDDAPSRGGSGPGPADAGLPGGVTTPAPLEEGPPRVCGPDIKSQVVDALNLTRSTFVGWTNSEKTEACEALVSMKTGEVAWDICELHKKDWIIDYRPDCAWNRDDCGSSATVDNNCHYMGAINYSLFGVQCKLCFDFLSQNKHQIKALQFTETGMQLFIRAYKSASQKTLIPKDLSAFQDWAAWGYRGVPTASTPDPSRPDCATTCPKKYVGGRFHIYWYPRSSYDNPI